MKLLPNIGILMPGDMGHACGKALLDNGFNVFTCLSNRSERTKLLAKKSGIKDTDNIENLINEVEIVLSILPPEFALPQARIVNEASVKSNLKKVITYVDCNAISPKTSIKIGDALSQKHFNFVDGGIIGLNPLIENGQTRLYLSGKHAEKLNVMDGKGIVVKTIGNKIGKASAMKMVYASATKGTFALHAAVITASRKLDLFNEYIDELRYSKPSILEAMEKMVPKIPLDAKRWEGEMLEIANTYKEINLTPKFHQGAADIMDLANKTPIANETRENFNSSRSLLEAVDMLVQASKTKT